MTSSSSTENIVWCISHVANSPPLPPVQWTLAALTLQQESLFEHCFTGCHLTKSPSAFKNTSFIWPQMFSQLRWTGHFGCTCKLVSSDICTMTLWISKITNYYFLFYALKLLTSHSAMLDCVDQFLAQRWSKFPWSFRLPTFHLILSAV